MSGRTIRAARAVLGWSTKKMAEEAGVGVATLNRFERVDDVYKKATVETAEAIMGAMNKGLDSIGWRLTSEGGISPMPKEPERSLVDGKYTGAGE